MYEDPYKNPQQTGVKELEAFLQLLADLNEPMELFAMGGTAMVLKGIKAATKDIDFMTPLPQERIRKLFTLAGLKEKQKSTACNIWMLGNIRIDLFYRGFVMGIPFPTDWKQKSEHVRDLGKLRLYILNWQDILITKIARNEPRDIEDCVAIIRHQNIDVSELKKRYEGIAETAILADYAYRFKMLEQALK